MLYVVRRSSADFEALTQDSDPLRKSYSVRLNDDTVLDCYEHMKQGLCLASLANDPRKCVNVAMNRPAKVNARISYHGGVVQLRAGWGERCPASFYLPPGDEILVNYGNLYGVYDAFAFNFWQANVLM